MVFTSKEMVASLRSLFVVVKERELVKFSGEESFKADVWQVQKGNGEWMDAEPVFRELVELGLRRSIFENVNKMDLIDLIK